MRGETLCGGKEHPEPVLVSRPLNHDWRTSRLRSRLGALYPFRRGHLGGKTLPDDKNSSRLPDRAGQDPLPDRDTGAALRSVYQKTIDEKIPDEMLDLLGKLD